MVLSRQKLITGAGVIAAFSVGGFFALQTETLGPDVDVVSVSETAGEGSTQTSSHQPSSSKSLTPDAATRPKICDRLCQGDVEKFLAWSKNNDETSEVSLAHVEEYAAYIKARPALRDRLIEMVSTQVDTDLRRLVVASFHYLGPQDQLDLSQALMSSPAWNVRLDSVSLLTSQAVLETQDEAQILSLISKEGDPRIAAPILNALGQSFALGDKLKILEYIDQRVALSPDPDIRGAALVAQTQLSLGNVTQMPPQVLESLQSRDHDYSAYGLQATDLILSKLVDSESDAKSSVFEQAEHVLEALIYSEHDVLPDRVLLKADYLYLRYFE